MTIQSENHSNQQYQMEMEVLFKLMKMAPSQS